MESFIADLPRSEAPTDAEVLTALRELVRIAEPFFTVTTASQTTIYHAVYEQAITVLRRY